MKLSTNLSFILILVVMNQAINATSFSYIKKNDPQLIEFSDYIIEGTVISVLNNSASDSSCFDYIYILKINHVMKGNLSINENVVIGLVDDEFHVFEGQTQFGLFALFEPDDKMICDLRPKEYKLKISDIKMTDVNFFNSTIYSIDKFGEKATFNINRCGENRLVFEDKPDLYNKTNSITISNGCEGYSGVSAK